MPKRLTPEEVLEQAKALVDRAAAIELPEAGQERGIAVRSRRSKLRNANRLLSRYITGRMAREREDSQLHIEAAEALEKRIDELWPEVLSHIRYEEAQKKKP